MGLLNRNLPVWEGPHESTKRRGSHPPEGFEHTCSTHVQPLNKGPFGQGVHACLNCCCCHALGPLKMSCWFSWFVNVPLGLYGIIEGLMSRMSGGTCLGPFFHLANLNNRSDLLLCGKPTKLISVEILVCQVSTYMVHTRISKQVGW